MFSPFFLVLLPLLIQAKPRFNYEKCAIPLQNLSEKEWEFHEKISSIYARHDLSSDQKIELILNNVQTQNLNLSAVGKMKTSFFIFAAYMITDVDGSILSRLEKLADCQIRKEIASHLIQQFMALYNEIEDQKAKKLFIRSMRIILSRETAFEGDKEELEKEIFPIVDCFKRIRKLGDSKFPINE